MPDIYDVAKTVIRLKEKSQQHWENLPSDVVILIETLYDQLDTLLGGGDHGEED